MHEIERAGMLKNRGFKTRDKLDETNYPVIPVDPIKKTVAELLRCS